MKIKFEDYDPNAPILHEWLSDTLIQMAGDEVSYFFNFPRQTSIFSALVYASHVAGSVYTICYPNGDPLPLPLYAITEQPPGAGKSSISKAFMDAYLSEAGRINEMVDKEKKAAIAEMKNGENVAEKEEVLNQAQWIPTVTGKATTAALDIVMSQQQGFFMLQNTEKDLINDLFPNGTFSSSPGALNSGYVGESISTVRANKERVVFHGEAYGGFYCMSQADTISMIIEQAGDTGFTERFVMMMEDTKKRPRKPKYASKDLTELMGEFFDEKAKATDATLGETERKECHAWDQYNAKMGELAKMRRQAKDRVRFKQLTRLRMTPSAKNQWDKFKAVAAKKASLSDNSMIERMYKKADMTVMKIAATLQIFDTTVGDEVGPIEPQYINKAAQAAMVLIDGVEKICAKDLMFGPDAEDEVILGIVSSARVQPENANTPKKICKKIVDQIKRRKGTHPFGCYEAYDTRFKHVTQSLERLERSGAVKRLYNTQKETYFVATGRG